MANYPVSVIYDDESDMQEGSFNLNAILLSKIEITTNPAKMTYHTGETMNYAGMVVTATYDDESTAVVTNSCIITPAAGAAFESLVEIVYAEGQDEKSCSLSLTEIVLQRIYIASQPMKTEYKSGETLDYRGLVIKAVYSDEAEVDITNQCSFSAQEGTVFNPDTDTSVEISYLDCSVFLNLTEITLTGISVTTNPTKMSYEAGEIIDYTGMEVTASYSDGSSKVVTSSCTITPRAGKVFDPDTDSSAEISYTEDGEEFTTNIMLVGVYPVSIEVTTNPTKTAYKHSENITYSGMVVTASYSDGSTRDVTSDCSMHPRAGKRFDADEDTNVTINYSEGSIDLTCSLTLTSITVTGLQITRYPYKVAYQSGEQIYYSGIVVTATYSDGSTDDVSSLCDYSAMWGKHFDPATDTNITITYSEGDDEVSCTLTLIEVSMKLIVDTLPTKTSYHDGDDVDYSGAVIKAVHTDASTHNVTEFCTYTPDVGSEETTVYVKCALPENPYVFDQNSGYIDNGVWKVENPTHTYIDIYRVTAGHKYLLAIGSNVGSRFRAMFTTTDISTATANVTGAAIINTNNPSANATVEYTPTANGYIAVGKDNIGKSGVRTFLYDANNLDKKIVTTFTLTNEGVLDSIAVTPPVKMRYRSGETYDYSGAVVTATYTDGSTADVTEFAIFDPPEGSTVVSNNTTELLTRTVGVTYRGQRVSFDLGVGGVALVSLELTLPPDKTVYYLHETLDFTGCVVSAVYYDGSKKDVTDKVTFDRSEMTSVAIESEYSDMTRNIPVTIEITYEETDEEVSNLIDYNNFISYSSTEGSSRDYYTGVTKDTPKPWPLDPPHYTPPTDSVIYEATYVDVQTMETKTLRYEVKSQGVYRDREFPEGKISDYWSGFDGSDPHEAVTSYKAYWQNASIDADYGSYSSRQFGILTESATVELGWTRGFFDDTGYYKQEWYAYLGAISPSRISFKPLLQLSYGFEASTTMNLYCKLIRGLTITPPTKSSYHYSEPFDPTGITAEAIFTDGEVRDVTSEVTITPSQGTRLTATIPGRVVYRNAFGSDYEDENFNITVITLQGLSITPPTKTSYRYGETVDYTGVSVVAVYSDDSREDVTSAVTFSPAAGTEITGDTNVTVSYTNQWTETTTGNISLTLASVTSISATNPTKTDYVAGEAIDYSGMVVTASYSDGTTEDVTSSCTITPRAGKAFNTSTDTLIHIEYDTGSTTLSTEVNFGIATLESIEVTAEPTKMHYETGETIDYTGLVVTASYSNGNSWDVTSQCSITPRAGKAFDSSTDTNVAISYTDNGVTQTADLTLLTGGLQRIDVTRYMDSPCTTLMDYTGIVVTATFSDGTSDVTDSCTFSPAQGHIVGDTATITYTADSVTKTYTLQLARVPLGIEVTTLPTKTSYAPGETADYSGAVVKMSYRNRISRTVTECCDFSPAEGDTINAATTVNISCPSSIEPYASDFKGYGPYKGEWYYVFSGCTDVYKVIAGHRYLLIGKNSSILQNNYVGFFESDVTKATSKVVGTNIAVTGSTSRYTPSADGYIAFTKPLEGVNSYLYDIDSPDKSKTATFAITATTLTGISITNNPTKTEYAPGESIDYSGLVVMASYSDGSTLDVAGKCSITPSAGKAFDPSTDTNVAITYMGNALSLTLTVATLTGIAVTTEPLKTQYVSGHHVDYTGIVVTSTYSNGSTFDVTNSCTFSPAQGETVSDTVTITYTDGTTTASCNLSLIVTSYSLVVETPPTKTTYTPGEAVDYSGAVIKMVYSDGTEHNVTDYCSYTPTVDGETTTVTVSCAPAEEYDNTVVGKGYINSNPWYWYPATDAKHVVRIYQAIAEHRYLVAIGIQAARLEAIFTTSDISQATSEIAGTGLRLAGVSSCYSYAYSPSDNGFLNVCTYIDYPKESPQYIYDADNPNKSVSTTFTLTTVEG